MCCSTVHFLTLLTRHQEVRGWTSWNSYILIKLYAGSRYVSKTSTAFCNSTVSVSMTASYKCTNNGPGNHTAALSRDPKQPYNIYIIFRPVAEQKTRWLGVLFLTMGYEWIETTASCTKRIFLRHVFFVWAIQPALIWSSSPHVLNDQSFKSSVQDGVPTPPPTWILENHIITRHVAHVQHGSGIYSGYYKTVYRFP